MVLKKVLNELNLLFSDKYILVLDRFRGFNEISKPVIVLSLNGLTVRCFETQKGFKGVLTMRVYAKDDSELVEAINSIFEELNLFGLSLEGFSLYGGTLSKNGVQNFSNYSSSELNYNFVSKEV